MTVLYDGRMKTNEVLQIGAGNIGRALVGEVMYQAGLHVTFADVNHQLINEIKNERGYPVQVVSLDGARQRYIDGIDAISSLDEVAMIGAIVEADIVTTAVGVAVLPKVAPIIAKGLIERIKLRPLDEIHVVVVACENVEKNTETLRDLVLAELPDDEWRSKVLGQVSFPNCAVDRIVPNAHSNPEHPLAVVTEDYYQLAVDRTALIGPMPEIPGIDLVDNLDAILAQKLFTLNGAHAAAAYWGYLKGYRTIDQAMGDPNIMALVRGLMDEVGKIIVRHYPNISAEEQKLYSEKIIRRFMNPYLNDDPVRVGRDPIRKLGAEDRLIKPALLGLEVGETPANLCMAIIGGLRFRNSKDIQAVRLQREIEQTGIDMSVTAITGLAKVHPISRIVTSGYRLAEIMS